jgi:hypothetical protein
MVSWPLISSRVIKGVGVIVALCSPALVLETGEVIVADKFTSNKEIFTENLRQAKWPNWHWVDV